MALKISYVSEDAGVVTLCAEGEITATDTPIGGLSPFQPILGQAWNGRRILLDMSGVSYIDSSGIGWLIGSQKSFRAAGGKLALHSVQPQVHQLLGLLKLDRIIPMTESAAAGREALAALVAV